MPFRSQQYNPLFLKESWKPFYRHQPDPYSCGAICLQMIVHRVTGNDEDLVKLKRIAMTSPGEGTTGAGIALALSEYGIPYEQNTRHRTPGEAISYLNRLLEQGNILIMRSLTQGYKHWTIVGEKTESGYLMVDPWLGIVEYSVKDLLKVWEPRGFDGYEVFLGTSPRNSRLHEKKLSGYTHGTAPRLAKMIARRNFELGPRGAVYFAPPGKSVISDLYGAGVTITVSLSPKKTIKYLDVQKKIIPEMQNLGLKVTEPLVNDYLRKKGYDMIIFERGNEVAVLDPFIIEIEGVQIMKESKPYSPIFSLKEKGKSFEDQEIEFYDPSAKEDKDTHLGKTGGLKGKTGGLGKPKSSTWKTDSGNIGAKNHRGETRYFTSMNYAKFWAHSSSAEDFEKKANAVRSKAQASQDKETSEKSAEHNKRTNTAILKSKTGLSDQAIEKAGLTDSDHENLKKYIDSPDFKKKTKGEKSRFLKKLVIDAYRNKEKTLALKKKRDAAKKAGKAKPQPVKTDVIGEKNPETRKKKVDSLNKKHRDLVQAGVIKEDEPIAQSELESYHSELKNTKNKKTTLKTTNKVQ